MPTPIITDGTMERVVAAPRVVLPDPGTLFAERAARFAQLAQGHPMGAYLTLMAALVGAQHAVIGKRTALPVPPAALAQSRDYGMPPMSALSHVRDAQWRNDLTDLLEALRNEPGASAAAGRLRALDVPALEAQADRVLAGQTLDEDAALVPFIGAALQVYFTRAAAALDVESVKNFDVPTVCPVCATRPVASIVRVGGDRNNLRYLACALCNTEWNVARIKCSACEDDKGVHYLALTAADAADAGAATDAPEAAAMNTAGAEAARKAEACDECKSYLKIFYQEKDAYVDVQADDLASLALDLLVDERGFGRSGPNLLFHPGTG
jgi:FdhE protein